MSDEERLEVTKEMSREDAEILLKMWAELIDLDTEESVYRNAVKELVYVVKTERLSFDEENEVFKYQLLKPVGDVSIVEIKECDFKAKKSLDRYKENESMLASIAMLTKYSNLTFQQVEMLKDRDISRISKVISFLSHTSDER